MRLKRGQPALYITAAHLRQVARSRRRPGVHPFSECRPFRLTILRRSPARAKNTEPEELGDAVGRVGDKPQMAGMWTLLPREAPFKWGAAPNRQKRCCTGGTRARRAALGRRKGRSGDRKVGASVQDVLAAPARDSDPDDPDEMRVINLHNYNFLGCNGRGPENLLTSRMVLDTGAGPSLVRADIIPTDWRRATRPVAPEDAVCLRDANGHRLLMSGTVDLWVRVGTRQVYAKFQGTSHLSVPVIMGCEFLERNSHALLPQDPMVRWLDGSTTAILRGIHDRVELNVTECRTLRAVCNVTLAPRTATIVRVRSQCRGLARVRVGFDMLVHHGATMATGVVDILVGASLPVVVTNYKEAQVVKVMRAHVNLGTAEVVTTPIIELPKSQRDVKTPEGDSVCVVGGTPLAACTEEGGGGDGVLPPAFSRAPPVTDGETPDTLHVEQVDLLDDDLKLRLRIRTMHERRQMMLSGNPLEVISSVQLRIDLRPGAKPVRTTPRRAVSAAGASESAEVDRMLAADVIEHAMSEWGFPVVMVPKKDGTLFLC